MTKRILVILLVTALAGTLFYIVNDLNSVDYLQPPELSLTDTPESSQTTQSVNTRKELCGPEYSVEYYSYSGNAPLWSENNKFGIYVYAENKDFFELAQKLVNSSGGDWGYVLIPYNVKDRDYEKWANVFDMLRNKHLIPVVQLWDVDPADYRKQTKSAASFLNSFLWPVKFRYISVYNEPNDSRFWYGRVAPKEYARILDYTISVFKEDNNDFFMLNGAFNTSAPSDNTHMDALEYMMEMDDEVPGIFNKLDGWASHPYPQPNFSGSPQTSGRWSIKAYDSELQFLTEQLNVEKKLPVFITETGWAHAEGEMYNGTFLPVETVAEYFKTAYETVWLPDDRVRAVIPFTIWYEPPFDHFSWVNEDRVPYYHYEEIKKIDKIKGNPPVLEIKRTELNPC